MLPYEHNLERAVMCMCEVQPSFVLSFEPFVDDIRLDYDRGRIIAPITESEPLMGYFKTNGFSIKGVSPTWYRISIEC